MSVSGVGKRAFVPPETQDVALEPTRARPPDASPALPPRATPAPKPVSRMAPIATAEESEMLDNMSQALDGWPRFASQEALRDAIIAKQARQAGYEAERTKLEPVIDSLRRSVARPGAEQETARAALAMALADHAAFRDAEIAARFSVTALSAMETILEARIAQRLAERAELSAAVCNTEQELARATSPRMHQRLQSRLSSCESEVARFDAAVYADEPPAVVQAMNRAATAEARVNVAIGSSRSVN